MYTVFQNTLMTDDTKKIVYDHKGNCDAQAIQIDLRKLVKSSQDTTIFINKRTSFLTTDKIDGRWKGSTKGYITQLSQSNDETYRKLRGLSTGACPPKSRWWCLKGKVP